MTNIGGSDGRGGQFLSNLNRRLERLENSLGTIGAKITRTVDAKQQIFVGPTSPVPNLRSGSEYVWYKTDGNGNLSQTIVGKVP